MQPSAEQVGGLHLVTQCSGKQLFAHSVVAKELTCKFESLVARAHEGV